MARKKVQKPTIEPVEIPLEAPVEPAEDRSAFNCPSCLGEGLVKQGTKDIVCSQCGGTGKI